MSIASNLNKSRKELLDLGLRNSLINHRQRTKQIRVIDELSIETFRILVKEEKTMSFQPLKKGDERLENPEVIEEEQTQLQLLIEDVSDGADSNNKELAKKYVDNKLQTAYDQQGLQKKLLSIHNDAKTYIEEQGVNILYLALGFLNWFESESSDEPRKAPLVLIPVELSRSDVKDRFAVNYSGGDISDNLSLIEKLKQEFNIKFATLGDIEELELNEFFLKATKAISNIDNWSIEPNEITLGFFSFGKFLMYKDLESENWPSGRGPEDNEIISALLENGFETKESLHGDETNLDTIISPMDFHLVMDADSSQLLSILEINEGRNLVIQGPPGTGKSQTITNIIAEAIGQDKKVLFVSEKMAALEVVKRRLDQVHLGDCALELHSYKTNKKLLLEEINRTLNLGQPSSSEQTGNVAHLIKYRDKLNEYASAVNSPIGKTNISFVTAVGKAQLIKTNIQSPLIFKFKKMAKWTLGDFKDKRLSVEKIDNHIQEIGNPFTHPFWGSQLDDFLPYEKEEILHFVAECQNSLETLLNRSNVISSKLNAQESENIEGIKLLIDTANAVNAAPEEIHDINVLSAKWKDDPLKYLRSKKYLFELKSKNDKDWNVNGIMLEHLSPLKEKIADNKNKWYRFLITDFVKAKKEVLSYYKNNKYSKGVESLLETINAFIEGKKCLGDEKKLYPEYKSLLLPNTNTSKVNWTKIYNAAVWIIEMQSKIKQGELLDVLPQYLQNNSKYSITKKGILDLEKSLKKYLNSIEKISNRLSLSRGNDRISIKDFEESFRNHSERFNLWESQIDRVSEWVKFNQIVEELEKDELGFIVDEIYDWPHNRGYLTASYDYSWYYGVAEMAFKNTPAIKTFSRSEHELTSKKFIDLDKEVLFYNQLRLALKHFDQIPQLSQGGGQLSIIQKEIHKKRRHMPIRELIKRTGQVLQAIKPVFMMSPMSIATYIPPGVLEFDLIVFDEASQVKPVDAFGALLRGKQAIVVGDDKQLPPTSFFDNLMIDEEEDYDYIGDMESILSLFLAKGANSKMLRWHYRSKHDSLIAVSNNEFYNNRLFIFPSSGMNRNAEGLVLHSLNDTFYDRGKSRTNPKEAEAVAKAVIQHVKEKPNLSLGVVAFSVAQRDAIIFHLENQRQINREYEHYFSATDGDGTPKKEPFFVKNLENVQGDERDIILISIGYGKTNEGYFPMSFGPLNREGGERRLNVLISRARLGMHVYSNFTAKDLDLERTNSRGVIALKNFLGYAETGIIDQPYSTDKEPDSPFEEAVLKMLKQNNIDAEPQVGTAGFFIDIGIKNPANSSEYILGVECDGASYHKTKSARDRDRIRQEVLESLGWKIYRIWSTDWFNNPESEFKKLLYAITRAKNSSALGLDGNNNQKNTQSKNKLERDNNSKQENANLDLEKNYYNEADFYFNLSYELYGITSEDIAGLIKQVVEVESPIHRDILAKRVSSCCGYSKVGSRLKQAIDRGIRYGNNEKMFYLKNHFLWYQLDHDVTPRNRSNLINSEKKIEYVTSNEIGQAIILLIKRSFSISQSELVILTAKLLGFSRVTDGVSHRIEREIKNLIKNKKIISEKGELQMTA